MRLGLIVTPNDPETVFSALRLAGFSLMPGDEVRIFFAGRRGEIDRREDAKFPVKKLAQEILAAGAKFFACGSCLKLRETPASEICPLSTMKDQYEVIREADKMITV